VWREPVSRRNACYCAGGLRNDWNRAGAGNDALRGGDGSDFMDGGAGSDVSKLSKLIGVRRRHPLRHHPDFARGEDRIDLSGVDAHPAQARSPYRLAARSMGIRAFAHLK
jgi:hypothetical protein